MARKFVRSIIWQALDRPGTEYCSIWKTTEGWILDGVVCRVEKRLPFLLSYEIMCDEKWGTKKVNLNQSVGAMMKKLVLRVDKNQRWWTGNRELYKLRGCIDVDLLVSPVTNTLPIRRMNLRNGESRGIRAAWVRSPKLSVQPLSQEYERLSTRSYRYRSQSGFTTKIEVDDMGLVVAYPHFWGLRATERLARGA